LWTDSNAIDKQIARIRIKWESIHLSETIKEIKCITAKPNVTAKESVDALPPASEIHKMHANFIHGVGCPHFVSPSFMEDFAFLRRGYL